MRYRSNFTTTMLYLTAALYAMIVIAPFLWLLMLSLKTQLQAFAYPPKFIFTPTLENYEAVLDDPAFMRSLKNSVIVAVGSVTLSLLFAIPAAFGLSYLRGRWRRNILTWLLVTRMAPGMVYVIPYFVLYTKVVDWLDTYRGLMLIYLIFNIPLVTWMLLPFWDNIPREIGEAALIDGAGPFQVLFYVDLPLVRPGIIAAGILAFVFSWNEFLFALVLTRREAITVPVTVVNFMAYEGTEWGKVAAGGVMILLPVVAFGFFIRKYLIGGLTAGAIKG